MTDSRRARPAGRLAAPRCCSQHHPLVQTCLVWAGAGSGQGNAERCVQPDSSAGINAVMQCAAEQDVSVGSASLRSMRR
jgi:hypothetical protein